MLGDLAVALADEAFTSGPLGGKLSILLADCRTLSNIKYLAVVWLKDAQTLIGAFNLAEPCGTEKWVGAYDRRRSFAGKVLKTARGTVLQRSPLAPVSPTTSKGKPPTKEYDALHAAARYGVSHMIGTVIPMHAEGCTGSTEDVAGTRKQAFGVLLLGYTAAPESHGRLEPTVLDLALFLAKQLPDRLPAFAEDMALFSPLLPSYRATCPCCGGNPHPHPHPIQPDDQNPSRCRSGLCGNGHDDAPHGTSSLLIPLPAPSLPLLHTALKTDPGSGSGVSSGSAGTATPGGVGEGRALVIGQGSGAGQSRASGNGSEGQAGFDEEAFYGKDLKAAARQTQAAVQAVQRPGFAMHPSQQRFEDPRTEAQYRYETAASGKWRDVTLLLIMLTYLFCVTYIKPFTISQYPGSTSWFAGFALAFCAILVQPAWYIKHRDNILAAWLIAIRFHAFRTVWLVVHSAPDQLPLVAMHCFWCFPVQFAIDSVFIMRDAWLRLTVMPLGIAAAMIAFPEGYGVMPRWAATLWCIGHILVAEGISLCLQRKSDAQTRTHFVHKHSSQPIAA